MYSYVTQGADLPAADFANLSSGGVFNAPGKITFAGAGLVTTAQITDLFNEMYYDELNQLIALRALLGATVSNTGGPGDAVVANRPTMNLLGTGVTTTATTTMTQPQFIGYARLLEDLSASAFAGATVYLTGTNLEYVAQALAVNGFHSGAVRLIAQQTGAYYYSGQEVTLGSAGAGSANSFSGVTLAGSPIVYYTTPTNAIVAGSDVSGPGIAEGTVITSVVPPTVFTGNITAGSNLVTNVTVTPSTATIAPAVGMTISSGTVIPTNSIITNINGSTITIGTVTGYTSATTPSPIVNGLTGISGSGGTGMTVGTYPLAFSGGGGGTGAVGTLTVLTATTFSVTLTNQGSGYTSAPTITATGLTVSTGGTLPTVTATVATQITTTASGITLTLGFLCLTTKSSNTLTGVSSTAGLVATSGLATGQFLSGTNVPTDATISAFSPSANTVTFQAVGATALAASASSTVTPTGNVTNGSPVITVVSSLSGIAIGMPISGTGIPSTATVAAVGFTPVGNTITMSVNATSTTPNSTATVAPTCFLTAGSNLVTALSSLSSLNVGATVTGTGIPSGTTVASVGGVNTMTLSQNATTTTATTIKGTPNAILASGNNIISCVYPQTGLASGQLITDTLGFIPPGQTITGVSSGNYTITISAPCTGSTVVSTLQSFTGTVTVSDYTISSISPTTVFTATSNPLAVGQPISGPNIPAGTIITAVSASTSSITISALPSAAAGAQIVGAALVTTSAQVITASSLQTVTVTTITNVNPTETVTIPNIENVTLNLLGNVVLSENATVTAATGATLTFLASDPMDVEPDDPGTISFAGVVTSGSASVTSVSSMTGLAVGLLVGGPGIAAGTTIATVTPASGATLGSLTLSTAATAGATTPTNLVAYQTNAATLAAGGPIAIPGTSPAAYQGFFDTAGGATSSANNPAGAVFARTFSQTLAVLYGSTVAQTYEGGFFPNGVGGNINNV
ncbi:MAG: ferritin-like domain-containing protein [Acidobacteriaceae bacterium]